MSDTIITALITGGLSLVGVVITVLATYKKQEKNAAIAQAVTDTKLEELTREVREHNNFAARMPVLDQKIQDMERRIIALEAYHKQPIN